MGRFRMARAQLRPRLPRVPEKVVQAQVVKLFRTFGNCYVIGTTRRRGDYQGTMQSRGIPDLIAFIRPQPRTAQRKYAHLYWETKAEDGRLSPEQKVFEQECELSETHHGVGGYDDAVAWLIQHGYADPSQFPHYRSPENPS